MQTPATTSLVVAMMNASSKSYCPYSLHLSIVDQTWRAPLLLMYHHRPFGLRGDQLITAPKQMENFVVFSPAIRLTFRIQVKTLYLYTREFVYSSTVAIYVARGVAPHVTYVLYQSSTMVPDPYARSLLAGKNCTHKDACIRTR